MEEKKKGVVGWYKNLANENKKKLKIFGSVVIVVYTFGLIIGDQRPDPCYCVPLLEAKPTPTSNIGLSDTEFRKWEKCYKAYSGPARATLECMKK